MSDRAARLVRPTGCCKGDAPPGWLIISAPWTRAAAADRAPTPDPRPFRRGAPFPRRGSRALRAGYLAEVDRGAPGGGDAAADARDCARPRCRPSAPR